MEFCFEYFKMFRINPPNHLTNSHISVNGQYSIKYHIHTIFFIMMIQSTLIKYTGNNNNYIFYLIQLCLW